MRISFLSLLARQKYKLSKQIHKRSRSAALLIAMGALLLPSLFVLLEPNPPTAEALFGRANKVGYFNAQTDSFGDSLLNNGLNCSSENCFTNGVLGLLRDPDGGPLCTSGNSVKRCRIVGAYYVNTMLGIPAGTGTVKTALNNWRKWASLVESYDAAGRVNWNQNVTYPAGSENTFWQGNGGGGSNPNDVASYVTRKSYNSKASIVFTNPDGSHYSIKKECGNVIGRPGDTPTRLQPLKAEPTISTQVSDTEILPGESVTDTITVNGSAGPASGNVGTLLCTPNLRNFDPRKGCQPLASTLAGSGQEETGSVTLNASGQATTAATNPTFTTTPGKYCFLADYRGDANYLQDTHTSPTNECFTVFPASLDVRSNFIQEGDRPGIGSLYTQVLVGQAQPDPDGTVTFYLCKPGEPGFDPANGCDTGGTFFDGPTPLNPDGSVDSRMTTPEDVAAPGTYCFRAEYSGNAGTQSDTNSTTSCFTVPPVDPVVSTTSDPMGLVDAVNVASSSSNFTVTPTGTVSFFLCTPTQTIPDFEDIEMGCQDGGLDIGTSTLDGSGAAVSPAVSPDALTQPGKYCWRAEYSGDTNYGQLSDSNPLLATESPIGECFFVRATPNIVTTSTPSPIGAAGVTDALTIPAYQDDIQTFPVPTGTVNFFLCEPGQEGFDSAIGCASGGTRVGGTTTLDATGSAVSAVTPVPLSKVGKYCWRAEYSGDTYYKPLGDYNGDISNPPTPGECFELKDSMAVPINKPGTTPGVHTDKFTAPGVDGVIPTGTVTFYLCSPGDEGYNPAVGCAEGGVQMCEPVILDAAGMAESCQATPTKPGKYCWRAEYSGDSIYAGAKYYNGAIGNANTNTPGQCFEIGALTNTGSNMLGFLLLSATTGTGAGVSLGLRGMVMWRRKKAAAAASAAEDHRGYC